MFEVSTNAVIETYSGHLSEEVSLEFTIEDDGEFFWWNLAGYGVNGIKGDRHETKEAAYQDAIAYTEAWAFTREGELQNEYETRRMR